VAKAVRFDLIADSSKFTRGMKDAQRSSQQFTQHTSNAGRALKAATAAFSVGVVITQMRNWVAAARDSNRVAAQTNAVIKSTRSAAGLSAKGFSDLAKSIEKTTAVDDDLIQGGENIIATFTAIHGDVFKKTTQAAVDLAAGMNHGQVTAEGLQTASIQLGKALQDPIKGVTALQRIGIKLSDQQKAQIATFVKNGQVAKAQGVILAEVNRQFAGSAAAAVTPAKRLAQQWGDMQEVLGNLLIPAIDRGAQILSSILGVVDRNRKAFGILFGVLGTGATIIGTLIVAEKVHAAVTDSVKVATAAWAAVQKGLNLTLGTTTVQSGAAAIAEGELATASAGAGAAATGASTSFGTLATRLGLLGAAAAAGAYQGSQFEGSLQKIHERSNPLAAALDTVFIKLHLYGDAVKSGAAGTKDLSLGQQVGATAANVFKVSQQQAAVETQTGGAKAAEAAKRLGELKTRLKETTGELESNRASMAQTIQSYDGLISKSKVTAAEVIKDIRNQVANFKTYSSDVHRLIKAGVNPAAIQELSQKGPQYVHALAVGSKRRLGEYKQAWADRQREIKTSFAASIDAQYQKLVKQIRKMQAEINSLKGKTVSVSAMLKLSFSKSFTQKDWAQVKVLTRGARGMLITQGTGPTADDVPALVSKGETIVSARDSADPAFRAWARARRIKGYAAGGAIGTISREAGDINRLQAKGTGIRMDRGITQMMKSFTTAPGIGASASVTSVANWTARILGRIAEAGAWARRIMFESGGNWTAVNRTDSNWLAGHPSVGGAQVIRGTFNAYAGRFRGTGPYLYGVSVNPWANSYAGANYAVHRYGSMAAVDPRVRPIGYDRGGLLPPGLSMAYNGTGRAEPVGLDEDRLARKIAAALVEALRTSPPRVAVDDIHAGLLRKKNTTLGRMSLGLS
jgi:hypothetical protein